MPQIINHPKFGEVSFPDEMSDEEIVGIFKKAEASSAPVQQPEPSLLDRAKTTFIESQKTTEQKASELMGKVDEALLASPARQAAPGDITTVGQAAFKVGEKIAPTVARYGPPTAALLSIPLTGGVSTPVALGYLASAGLAGETMARKLENRPVMTPMEQVQVGVESSVFAPMQKAPGVFNYLTGATLEGLGLTVAEQNRLGQSIADVSPYSLATSLAIAYGGRGFEGMSLFNQANKDAQAINRAYNATSESLGKSINERGLRELMSLPGIPAGAPKSAKESAAILAGAPENKVLEQFIAIEQGLKDKAYVQNMGGLPSTARQSAEILAGAPQNSALESFIAIDNGMKERGRLALDFAQAKNELKARELAQEMKLNQLGTQESIEIVSPLTAQATFLDTKLGEGVGAVRERSRIAAQLEGTPAAVASRRFDQSNSISAKLSPKAQRIMDEYGFIDPRLASAIARGGVGGLAGIIQGDTFEEDLGYGLGYAITGAVLSPSLARKVGTIAKDVGTKMVSSKTGTNWVPEIVLKPFMETIRAGDAYARALSVESNYAYKQLNQALNKFPETERQAANQAVLKYIKKEISLDDLPVQLRSAAANSREAVDNLADELVVSGAAKGDLANTVLDNKGSYIRRSYELFANPDYKADPVIFKEWVDAHVADKLKDSNNKFTRTELQQQFTNEATRLLDRDVAGQYLTQGYAKTDRNIFTARNPNLDTLTRKLYGEISDPLMLLSDTSPRIARTVADYKMKESIAKIGNDLGLISPNASGKLTKEFTGRVDPLNPNKIDSLNPLAGLFTTPEIYDAFNSLSANTSNKFISAMSTAVKIPKTLGSIKGYVSNVYNGGSDLIAQGHALQLLDVNNWDNAFNNLKLGLGVVNDNGSLSKNKALQLHKKFVELGIVNNSIPVQDFINSFDPSWVRQKTGLIGAAKKPLQLASLAYSAPETLFKLFAFNGELQTMRKAFPTMPMEDAMAAAANKVRGVNTNSDAQWKIMKKASNFGALDPFVAYTADRYRITYNTFKLGLSEMKSPNPVIREAGAKRIAYTTGLIAAAGVAGGIGGIYGFDKAKDAALRRRAPDYLKNGILSIDSKGRNDVSFTNLNYIIPQTIVMEAATAAMRGMNAKQASENFFSVFGEQFFGASLIASPLFQWANNKNSQGVPIYSKNDDFTSQGLDVGQHLIGEWFTPLVVSDVKKIKSAWKEPIISTSGKVTNVEDIGKGYAGFRIQRYEIPTLMTSEAKAFTANIASDRRMFEEAKKTSVLESEKQAAFNKFEQRRVNQFNEIVQWAKDAKTLGMSESEIAKMGRDAKMPPMLILGAMEGIYTPSMYEEKLSSTGQIIAWSNEGKSQAQIQALIKDKVKTDPNEAKNLYFAYTGLASKEIKGINDMDRLILSLDDRNGERVNYLVLKAKNMAKEQGQNVAQGYLLELERKGIILPPMRGILESVGVMQKKRF